jgi:O-antigen/teichoic acid export membrane protein
MSEGMVRAVGIQAIGAAFCAAVSFALLLMLGRVWGSEVFGRYVFLLNAASLALVLIEAGWPTLLYRQGAQLGMSSNEGLTLMGAALSHVLAMTILLGLISMLVLEGDAPAMTVALGCMGCVAGMNLVSGRMRAAGRFGLEAAWQSAGRALSAGLIALVVVVLGWRDPVWIFAAWTLGLLIAMVLGGRRWMVWPIVRPGLGGYRKVLPFMLMGGLAMWLLKGDMVLLGAWDGGLVDAQTLSFYAAGTRLTEAGLLLMAALGNVLLGRFSRLAMAGDGAASLLVLRSLAVQLTVGLLGIGLLAVVLAEIVGEELMLWLFGKDFAGAGALLPWVLAVLPFTLGNVVLVPLLTSLQCERGLAACMATGGGVLLVGLPWMVSMMGARGGALSVALAHGVVFVSGWALAWRALSDDGRS